MPGWAGRAVRRARRADQHHAGTLLEPGESLVPGLDDAAEPDREPGRLLAVGVVERLLGAPHLAEVVGRDAVGVLDRRARCPRAAGWPGTSSACAAREVEARRSSPVSSQIFGRRRGRPVAAPVGPSRTVVGSVDRMSATITTGSPPLIPICGAPWSPYASSDVEATTTRLSAGLPTRAWRQRREDLVAELDLERLLPWSRVEMTVLPVRPSARVSPRIVVASAPTGRRCPGSVVHDVVCRDRRAAQSIVDRRLLAEARRRPGSCPAAPLASLFSAALPQAAAVRASRSAETARPARRDGWSSVTFPRSVVRPARRGSGRGPCTAPCVGPGR